MTTDSMTTTTTHDGGGGGGAIMTAEAATVEDLTNTANDSVISSQAPATTNGVVEKKEEAGATSGSSSAMLYEEPVTEATASIVTPESSPVSSEKSGGGNVNPAYVHEANSKVEQLLTTTQQEQQQQQATTTSTKPASYAAAVAAGNSKETVVSAANNGAASTSAGATPTTTPAGQTTVDGGSIDSKPSQQPQQQQQQQQQVDPYDVSDLEEYHPSEKQEQRRIARSKKETTTAAATSEKGSNTKNSRRSGSTSDDDDGVIEEDSSNDESSYFADPSNLPSPKSGRRFSFSSNASAPPMRTTSSLGGGAGGGGGSSSRFARESDASLSLSSDDSDDARGHHRHRGGGGHHHHSHSHGQSDSALDYSAGGQQHQQNLQQFQINHLQQPQLLQQQGQQQGVRRPSDLHVFPQQITRIHSVSSLVSTSSQHSSGSEEDDEDSRSAGDSDEEQELCSSNGAGAGGNRRRQRRSRGSRGGGGANTPSERCESPVLGQHHPGGVTPTPPTIYDPNMGGYTQHPHPQQMSQEQFSSWEAAGASVPVILSSTPYNGHSAANNTHNVAGGAWSPSTLEYSEDGDQKSHENSPQRIATATSGSSGEQQQGSNRQQRGGSKKSKSKNGPSGGGGGGGPEHYGYGGGGNAAFQQQMNGGLQQYGAPNKGVIDYQGGGPPEDESDDDDRGFEVYWQRWIMLMYMALLNLLSDWTCYSVAPIALLAEEAFGSINPELLVVVFLGANGISTACEPIILSRLGLKKTVLFGALLLMIGSIVKSGGMPPIVSADLTKGEGEWRVYLGFFLVGLSQPLYQCTPALLSASWFPENERTMATGVALNANQVGIGFAFIFGTLLVADSDDIPAYFGLLSTISTLAFLGTLFQFDDAPPTPPSSSARVMRGTMAVNMPTVQSIMQSVRNLTTSSSNLDDSSDKPRKSDSKEAGTSSKRSGSGRRSGGSSSKKKGQRSSTTATSQQSSSRSRRSHGSSRGQAPGAEHGASLAPSPAFYGSVADSSLIVHPAPSPMMPGNVAPAQQGDTNEDQSSQADAQSSQYDQGSEGPGQPEDYGIPPNAPYGYPPYPMQPMQPGQGYQYEQGAMPQPPQQPWPGAPGYPMQQQPGMPYYGAAAPYEQQGFQGYPQQFAQPVWDPRIGQYVFYQPPPGYGPPPYGAPQHPDYHSALPPQEQANRQQARAVLPMPDDAIDFGAEPTLTITPHHLDIDIRDDQVILAIRACFARRGFLQALVSFTVSGIVINTLSTFMDYLVRLNGAGREYTGIVGGSFQGIIMISSLLIGQVCDRTRAYYSITIAMLVLGAFGLAQCGVSLNADRGSDLRWSLIVVAALIGPLQPVSTELGVEVVYPLSENTVLVIQQLFSNLLSALFIPFFKALKDYGSDSYETEPEPGKERPEYTFSFYLLIVLHALATLYFASFNGRYLRYEHEEAKKAKKEEEKRRKLENGFHPLQHSDSERQALMP